MTDPVLVGREHEQQMLAAALADANVRTICVRGGAGQGKSALAGQSRRLAGGRVFSGQGKHAEGVGGRDARPLGQALGQILDEALDDLSDPVAGLGALRDRLGASAAALAPLDIPGLATAVGEPGTLLSTEVAVERLSMAVVRLLEWIGGFGRPIVLVLDDWGRASSATRDLYARIGRSIEPGTVLLGTERTNEPAGLEIDARITLAPLRSGAFGAIAAGLLDEDPVAAAAVIDAMGVPPDSPLQLVQAIVLLKASGALSLCGGGWTLDRSAAAALLGGSATEALVESVRRGSPGVWPVAAALAVFGDRAGLNDLAAVAQVGDAEFETALAHPSAAGLVTVEGGDVRFPHDTLRAALLAGIDGPERGRLAGRWAEHLCGRPELRGPALEAAARLRLEAGLGEVDAVRWAPVFIEAAQVCRAVGASAQARAFASAAMELEGRGGLPSFEAVQESALAAMQAGDLKAAADFAQLMRTKASGEQQRAAAALIEVLAERLGGRSTEALRIGLSAIADEASMPNFPARVSQAEMIASVLGLRFKRYRGDGPSAVDRAASHRLIYTVGALAFEVDPILAVAMAARMAVHPPLDGAYTASLRTMLSCLSGDWSGAVRYGHAAFERLEGEVLRAPAMQIALQFGVALQLTAVEARAAAQRLQTIAIEDGDAGVASYAVRDKALCSMRMPISLTAHRAALADCREAAGRFDDQATVPFIDALDQMAVNLLGGSEQPWRLQGDLFDAPKFERDAEGDMGRAAMGVMTLEAVLSNAFGAWETTAATWRRMGPRFDTLKHHPVAPFWSFHTGLARARLGLPIRRWERFAVEREARFNPKTFKHRALALRAEEDLRRGRTAHAFALYDAAIAEADLAASRLEHGVVATAALSAAKAARRDDLAERFHRSAQAAWSQWGATALFESGADALLEPRDAEPADVEAQRQAAAAQRASRAKTRLLSEAAHELRSPMQGIQSLLDLAAEEPGSVDMDQVRQAFSGMRSVVDDITDLSAVEADSLSLLSAPFEPAALARRELNLLAPRAEAAGRALEFAEEGAVIGSVLGDAARIGQVVRNLLTNAMNYGDGPISLTVRRDDRSGIIFEVADRGTGLSAADHARLFQPFARGDASIRAQGSGLGLALSRRLAERMGGSLVAEDREGGGALFRFRALCPPAPQAADAARRRPLRILLAEDVDLARDTMVRLLQRRGHAVTAVADGLQAVEAARDGAFDVLIFDALMPTMGGPEALAEIRRRGIAAPALVLSASVSDALAHSLSALTPVRLHRKPLTADGLEAALQDMTPAAEPAVARAMAAEVVSALTARLLAAEGACAQGDLAAVRMAAHAAAGLAAQLGMPETDAAFSEAEAAVLAGGGDRLTRALYALRRLEAAGFEPVNAM